MSAPPAPNPPAKSPAPSPAPSAPVSDESVWASVREKCGSKPAMRAMFDVVRFEGVVGNAARLRVGKNERAYVAGKAAQLGELLSETLGRPVRVELAVDEPEAAADVNVSEDVLENPIVKKAIELFDARVVRVEEDPEGG